MGCIQNPRGTIDLMVTKVKIYSKFMTKIKTKI